MEGKKGEEQVGICHDLIRELVMETRKYAELLGDVRNDGTKIVSVPWFQFSWFRKRLGGGDGWPILIIILDSLEC